MCLVRLTICLLQTSFFNSFHHHHQNKPTNSPTNFLCTTTTTARHGMARQGNAILYICITTWKCDGDDVCCVLLQIISYLSKSKLSYALNVHLFTLYFSFLYLTTYLPTYIQTYIRTWCVCIHKRYVLVSNQLLLYTTISFTIIINSKSTCSSFYTWRIVCLRPQAEIEGTKKVHVDTHTRTYTHILTASNAINLQNLPFTRFKFWITNLNQCLVTHKISAER